MLWADPLGSVSQDRVRETGPARGCPPDLRRKGEGQCWMVSEEPPGSGDASTGPEPTSLRARRRGEGGLSILLMGLPKMGRRPPKRANSRRRGADAPFHTQCVNWLLLPLEGLTVGLQFPPCHLGSVKSPHCELCAPHRTFLAAPGQAVHCHPPPTPVHSVGPSPLPPGWMALELKEPKRSV